MTDNYIKLFTTTPFHNADFAELLCEVNVEAAPVTDGIILNHTQFTDVEAARMPVWVYLNRDDINSKLHTRPASMREFRDAESAELGIKLVGNYATSAFGGWEFGQDSDDMYYRGVYEDYVGEWEKIDDYSIADDDCSIIYHLRGGLDVSSGDIMRVGA